MRSSCVFILALLLSPAALSQNENRVFRFHAGLEPATVDPAALNEPGGGFMFFNLYRSLFRLDANNQPQPELAQSCQWVKKTLLRCTLRSGLKFSNGKAIKAQHWVNAWRRLIDPGVGSKHSELLLPIKNAGLILKKEKQPAALGVRAIDDDTLEIEVTDNDGDFLLRLAAPVLTPLFEDPPQKPGQFASAVSSGPYRVKEWVGKTRIRLSPNPHYFDQNAKRPEVEILIVEEDSTALQMYDLGKLDFLRRLPVKEIESRKKGPDFLFIPMYRFDYVGFGPQLEGFPRLREALQKSLNYAELTKAYLTPGKVGCPSLPETFSAPWPCAEFDLKAAKAALAVARTKKPWPEFTLVYAKGGGEDVSRGMEWMQSQWKKHLGLNISLRPMETAMFWQQMKIDTPILFRKGMNLSRPSCLAAVESFKSSSPDNAIRLRDKTFDRLIEKLSSTQSETEKKKLCGRALKILVQDSRLIPLGELHFAMLAKPGFRGWRVTPLNQLDLTNLEPGP